jgi:hypothetical protein
MGKSFSKAVSSIKVPVSEKTQEQFDEESQNTTSILKERREKQKLENQIKAANAERLAAAEAERLATDEELAREAKKKPLLTAKDIENLQLKIQLSPEEFEKHQEKQIKEEQIKRRNKAMATLNKLQKPQQQPQTEAQKNQQKTDGGNNKNNSSIIVKKEILGKERCIYKKVGDRKEYVKHKGNLITVKDYKRIIKARNNKRI